MTANYRIGWIGGGQWYNYTRNFPQGSYRVLAALSHDTTNPSALRGTFDRVTSGANTTSQTLEPLGVFDAPGSGGWGSNNRVPLQDDAGNERLVTLSGLNTVRYTSDSSADIDYFLFELVGPPQIRTQPADFSTTEGNSASFTVELVSTAGATYQWLRNNVNLPGATSPTYFIPAVDGCRSQRPVPLFHHQSPGHHQYPQRRAHGPGRHHAPHHRLRGEPRAIPPS